MTLKDGKVDIATALRAYQVVIDHGERDGPWYVYDGLRATTDIDGYTVTLSDGDAQLRIFFHNHFDLEAGRRRVLDRFLARIERVANAG